MFQIDLTTEGKLLLWLPTGRTLEISATAEGVAFIKKIIHDHQRNIRNQPGYIGTLPTQHAVDKAFADNFLREKAKASAAKLAEETKTKAKKLDIDWDRLEINL